MSNLKLTEIVAQAASLESLLIESGGELTPDLEALLNEVEKNLTEKADGYSAVLARLEHAQAGWAEQAEKYQRVASSIGFLRSQLKERIKMAMIAMGRDEIRCGLVRFKLQKTNPSLVIDDKMLPLSYQIVETTYKPDKERIRSELKAGATIPGATLQSGQCLREYANKEDK